LILTYTYTYFLNIYVIIKIKMRSVSTREKLDKSSLLKMPAKIKLGRGKRTKKHKVTKASPLPSLPGRPPLICKVKNPRQ
jgi:hypothetical protein